MTDEITETAMSRSRTRADPFMISPQAVDPLIMLPVMDIEMNAPMMAPVIEMNSPQDPPSTGKI